MCGTLEQQKVVLTSKSDTLLPTLSASPQADSLTVCFFARMKQKMSVF